MIYPTIILENLATGRFHPVPFRMAPMPGGADSSMEAQRYKSIGHHTEGFATIEAAAEYLAKKHDPTSDNRMIWAGEIEPWNGQDVPADVQFFDVKKLLEEPPRWQSSETGANAWLKIGTMRLAVTDQSDRGCGWCWHVSADHEYGGDTIASGSGKASADEAKAWAMGWARNYCMRTLVGLAIAGTAPLQVRQ